MYIRMEDIMTKLLGNTIYIIIIIIILCTRLMEVVSRGQDVANDQSRSNNS